MLPKHVSTLLTTGNEVTRIFHIDDDNTVVVRHSPITDGLEVTLNGILMRTIEETGNIHWFAQKKKKYVIRVQPTSNWLMARAGLSNYSYELEVDGKKIPENNELLSRETSASASGVTTANIRIQEYVIQGDNVVWYLIQWPDLNVHVHRRYRDFWLLYSQVCSAFRGTHMYGSVPEPPPREMGLSSNKSQSFLDTRMRSLGVFLKKLAGFPGIKGGFNPDVQEFLGIGSSKSGVYETSVVFKLGRLGLKLKQPVTANPSEGSTFSAQVSELVTDDPESQIVQLEPGRIKVGDMITRVAGESALLIGYDKVVSLLQSEQLRPVVVHFLGCRDVE